MEFKVSREHEKRQDSEIDRNSVSVVATLAELEHYFDMGKNKVIPLLYDQAAQAQQLDQHDEAKWRRKGKAAPMTRARRKYHHTKRACPYPNCGLEIEYPRGVGAHFPSRHGVKWTVWKQNNKHLADAWLDKNALLLPAKTGNGNGNGNGNGHQKGNPPVRRQFRSTSFHECPVDHQIKAGAGYKKHMQKHEKAGEALFDTRTNTWIAV